MTNAANTIEQPVGSLVAGDSRRVSPTLTAQRLAPMLKALADENRLAIVLTLAEGSRSVVDLTEELGLSQTLVSHHLKALRECHLVSVAAKGRRNVYSMCCDELAEPVRVLAAVAGAAQSTSEQGA
jgi:DNA-binding transcriptional ArsR family regulator